MEENKNELSRRKFMEIGSVAAATTAGALLTGVASAQSSTPVVKTGISPSLIDPGPTDKSLDSANLDSNQSPLSDAGGVATSSIPSHFRTSAFTKVAGRARSQYGSSQCQKRWRE